ncbi:uncharacterized protein LOC116200788 isoform X1 [Punica granatum]|uniref:Uncharacterized protein LOC116200788 isoform X1 n=2 Tax=Punica granatum TaxID=22663 RepID=A0A6P8CSE6_PUNGR|nr:uncharacterized protein LOC116200788 isoform X1 [Punica granatum]
MLGAGLKFGRGEDRFYSSAKARRARQSFQRDSLRRAQSDVTPSETSPFPEKPLPVASPDRRPENRTALEPDREPYPEPVVPPLSNLQRFLESITPFVPAQHLSKTAMRGRKTCDVEFQPYFVLGDLWESFKEWSAYGAGVPLVLNDSDCVVQYYVPYLSGIQIFIDTKKTLLKPRRPGEDSYSDYRSSGSEGSSDGEHGWGSKFLREQNHCSLSSGAITPRLESLSMRDQNGALPEDISSDEGESSCSEGHLLFEYFEWNPPYSREPLADKISDLAQRFPELRTLRSCDLQQSSWISVAWYPIYRIPTGPTLKDLDACFLTYHFLHISMEGANGEQVLRASSRDMDGIPRMPLRAFGLASYKLKESLWNSIGLSDRSHVANSFHEAADDWLRSHQVSHPDFQFFCRR